jgi:hypothetical protein
MISIARRRTRDKLRKRRLPHGGDDELAELPDNSLGPEFCALSIPKNAGTTVAISEMKGVVAASSDEGHTWQPEQLPAGVDVVVSLSCPSTDACYAFAILQSQGGKPLFGLLTNRS